ncbi:hypothetical protein N7452_008760 [Penicillium brevicompactum]|uniref:Amino acid transporter transmembrane domain-containing protein n=1 Tax=Penicillium brevicompactum TaxID=5074 RepID=A0A9W9UBL6_PENBR|nr:hypothetical protein N7452_008760 [Penicillium brevicompactum]
MELNVQHQDQDDKKSNHSEQNPTHDCVFGELTEEGPNYRNVGFVGTVVLMMKTQIGLGVLAVPTAFDTLGIVPGVICLSLVACIITWSNCVIGTFKLNHPEIYSIDDAGALIFGRIGRGVLSVAFCLYWIFVVGSGALGISIGLNSITSHGTCTASQVSWGLHAVACGHLEGSPVMIIVIAVGIQDRPASAPLTDTPWVSDYQIIAHPSFTQGIAAVSKIVFALSGTPGFFAIVSEMRDPRNYTQAVLICQITVTAVFMTIGCVVYYYCGSYVASPALGSAGGIIKKISYGFAMPGLIVTTTICTHIPAKYIFVNLLRGSRHLNRSTPTHWMVWISCTLGVTVIAYIIASTIPVFNSLVSLIGALLGTMMCFQPMGCMWLFDNWEKGRDSSRFWLPKVCWAVCVIACGCFLTVAGTYSSVVGIMVDYEKSGGSAAFSCADNSNST